MNKKSKIIFFIFVLCFFWIGILNANAKEIDTSQIESKLETNSSHKGKKFKVGMMGNYYKIELKNKSAYFYGNKKILQCSETESVASLGLNGIQRKKNILSCNIVGFSEALPRGYGYVVLNYLGIDDDSKTNDTYNINNSINVNLFGGTSSTIYTTEIVDSSTYYSDIDRVNKNKATLYLKGDVIKVVLTVKQYQSWWWGDQQLTSKEVTAYVICNLYDSIEYSN